MKKRKNIIISAITCMMSICLMMFGVYAASNPSVSISGQVSYSARDAKVLVLGKVNGQAGEDQENKIAYPSVADTSNPQEDEKVVNASQYMGFTKGTGVNDDTDDLAKWDMNTTHAFYEDSTGIRPITISFMLRNLSNYPVVATVDFTGVTDTNLASKNLTRETTGMTNDNKVYLDKGRAKEISITYDVANDAQGVNGNNLLDMDITFEKTVFPETMKGEVQIDGQTINQSDWTYSFDGDGFTVAKFSGEFPQKVNGESTLEIPSKVKCEDGIVYPIKTIGTMTDYDFAKVMESGNEEMLFSYLSIVDASKLIGNDGNVNEEYFNTIPSNIVIPEGIEKINSAALVYATGIKSLPESVKEIGGYGCAGISITSLNLPNLKKIGIMAFTSCSSLTTINLPNLAWIGDSAFEGCENLTTMIIQEEDVSKIYCGKSIFGTLSSSSNLKIYVPVEDYKTATNWSEYADRMVVESIVTVGDWNIKLDKKNLTCDIVKYVGDATKETLTIPALFNYKNTTYNVVAVGSKNQEDTSVFYGDLPSASAGLLSVFSGAGTAKELDTFFKNSDAYKNYNIPVPYFKSIVIENGIQKLNKNLFSGLLDVQQISIPQSVTFLGDDIFTACYSLQSITLPDQISTIPSGCFTSCFALKNIDLPASLLEISKSAFSSCTSLETVVIPNNVTKIGEKAFDSCKNLLSVTLPKQLETLGDRVFNNCYRLAEVVNLSNADLNSSNVQSYAVRIATSGTSQIRTVGDFKFVTGNDGTDYLIGYFGESTTDIVVPTATNAYKIKSYAFAGNAELVSLTISTSISDVGSDAFYNCYHLSEIINLANIDLSGKHSAVRVASSGTSAVQTKDDFKYVLGDDGNTYLIGYFGNKSFKNGEVTLPQFSYNWIKADAFLYVDMPDILIIPNCVEGIGSYAFGRGSTGLSTVVIPDSVKYIGYLAIFPQPLFIDGIDNLTIGAGVTEIAGELACRGTLTIKATVPPTVTSNPIFNGEAGSPSKIYVTKESVEAYKTAENWSQYADIIFAIEG